MPVDFIYMYLFLLEHSTIILTLLIHDPDSVLSSGKMSDDCVSKVASPVREKGLISLVTHIQVKLCPFHVPTVRYSD